MSKHVLPEGMEAELVRRGVTNIVFFDKGKRGIVYTAKYNGKKVIVKVKRSESTAVSRMEIEAKWLQELNGQGIGPSFLFSGQDYIVYVMVEGKRILDFVKKAKTEEVYDVVQDVFSQMYLLDTLGITKEEMHHPVKHILVDERCVPHLIDFERCRHTQSPKNITQFCQFLRGPDMSAAFKKKKIGMNKSKTMKLSKEYKHALEEFHKTKGDKKKINQLYDEIRWSITLPD